jgi:hypothetical protein
MTMSNKRSHEWTKSAAAGKPVPRPKATGGKGSTDTKKEPAKGPRNLGRKPV